MSASFRKDLRSLLLYFLKSDSLMPPKVIAESVFFSPEINVADVASLFTPRTDTLDAVSAFPVD